ncbi:thioesterase family protein [Luteipulveratus flavus]|uniref:Thioesterase family protein n=1 Tax=Luteipulveratus flavus TaxID=3031728 RepID=A0ABT6CBV6_9MICO|nr:thioesterase family protein [Luteipulveratus sp. YIM 133296]MDF8266393.1 thioesterase family protein [Luteipulveratus sp. YIM 133296]
MTAPTDAYYLPLGPGRYAPTPLVQGAWREDEQHMSVVAGLITHELERHDPRPDMVLSRVAFEILGQIPLEETDVQVATVRPGRTIELLEATATIGGRVIIRARAWRLQRQDTAEVAGLELPGMPDPESCEPTDAAAEWQGRFLTTLEYRAAPGGRDGRRQVWARTPVALVGGVDVGPTAAYVTLVDLANGIATRVRPTQMMYPNVDLTIHLLRAPDPAWIGLDTSVSFGEGGIGLTSTTLNDVLGPVGRAEQSLTVRHFPS